MNGGPFARVVEKPIGRDLASAKAINDGIAVVFDERQIFRIDHYLGKETVQNILVLRFANSFLEPIVNLRPSTTCRLRSPSGRGGNASGLHHEQAGALRDMVQNHPCSC
jgi:glucose-6-phosphate 1-dehydrogenase